MSLTINDIADIIDDCRLYEGEITRPMYTRALSILPKNIFNNDQKKCRIIREKIALYNPVSQRLVQHRLFNYRDNKPMHSREYFSARFSNIHIVLIILLIFFVFI